MFVNEGPSEHIVEGEGADMSHVPPQGPACLTIEPADLVNRLSEDLERAIAFAEECRWRFPELAAEADQLAAHAMALFGKSMRSLREDPLAS